MHVAVSGQPCDLQAVLAVGGDAQDSVASRPRRVLAPGRGQVALKIQDTGVRGVGALRLVVQSKATAVAQRAAFPGLAEAHERAQIFREI